LQVYALRAQFMQALQAVGVDEMDASEVEVDLYLRRVFSGDCVSQLGDPRPHDAAFQH
jgi:hypothetical protein